MFELEADCFFKLDESLDEITEDDKCGYILVKLATSCYKLVNNLGRAVLGTTCGGSTWVG